jgi:hypothetical protein
MVYVCPLCNLNVDISEESDEPDVEIIDNVVCHASCIITFYNAHKDEVNLTAFERKLMKRRPDGL